MIKVQDIQYVVYGVTDLDRTEAFLDDFGLVHVASAGPRRYFRGAGLDAYAYVAEAAAESRILAIGMRVASAADLQAATQIEGASALEPLTGPGGGQRVRVQIPGGISVELVHGIAPVATRAMRDPLPLNHGQQKNRYNQPQRPDRKRLEVMRLGHAALVVTDVVAARDWAVRNLGMIVSDGMLMPGEKDVYLGFFMRCDLGATPSDHHTLLLATGECAGVHHVSFEMQDADAVHMAHEWLRSRGHEHHWGVGRHVLGSQVFDYWWDPDGMRMEHYADGDLFDNTVPAGLVEGTPDQLWMWGPEVPESFFQQTRQG
jgi:catechol 2,3-dioxygenase-like lactoylglutathione lyase family enzyme